MGSGLRPSACPGMTASSGHMLVPAKPSAASARLKNNRLTFPSWEGVAIFRQMKEGDAS